MTDSDDRYFVYFPEGTEDDLGQPVNSGWYFWDEAGLLGWGPYDTKEQAREGLNEYCEVVLRPVAFLRSAAFPMLFPRRKHIEKRADWLVEGF